MCVCVLDLLLVYYYYYCVYCVYPPTHLLRLLMKCQVSGGQREEVGRTVTSALQLARKHAPNELIPLYKQAVSILLYYVYCAVLCDCVCDCV